MKSFSVFILVFICLCSCTQKPPTHSSGDSLSVQNANVHHADTLQDVVSKDTVKAEMIVQSAAGKTDLYFQPYVYELTGVLTTETFYGPPNYGDDPAHDSKELFYMLNLDAPVNILVHPGDENEPIHDFDAPVTSIQKLEVAFDGEDSLLRPYINKRITLKGELFGAFNAHHHTDVLIAAKEIVE